MHGHSSVFEIPGHESRRQPNPLLLDGHPERDQLLRQERPGVYRGAQESKTYQDEPSLRSKTREIKTCVVRNNRQEGGFVAGLARSTTGARMLAYLKNEPPLCHLCPRQIYSALFLYP